MSEINERKIICVIIIPINEPCTKFSQTTLCKVLAKYLHCKKYLTRIKLTTKKYGVLYGFARPRIPINFDQSLRTVHVGWFLLEE